MYRSTPHSFNLIILTDISFYSDCNEEAEITEGNIDTVSDYEFIEQTDPYLDYCEIDERDMISDLDRSFSPSDSEKTAPSRLSTEDTDSHLRSDPSLAENLKIPSPDLMGSISREISTRGINLQKEVNHSRITSNKKLTNDVVKRRIPNTPPMPCRGLKGMTVFSQRPQTTEA